MCLHSPDRVLRPVTEFDHPQQLRGTQAITSLRYMGRVFLDLRRLVDYRWDWGMGWECNVPRLYRRRWRGGAASRQKHEQRDPARHFGIFWPAPIPRR